MHETTRQHDDVEIRTGLRAGEESGMGMGSGNATGGMMGGGGATSPGGGILGSGN
jgi:hypothetical protein